MIDQSKTKQELFEENAFLKQKIQELEQLRSESKREGEDRFRLMFMNAPMPYQSLDENGCFIDVNQALLDILGYTRDELIGRNFGDVLHPDWVDHFKENFPRFKAIGEILGIEFEMVKKDGSTIPVYFNGKIQRDDQGCFQRTHCIFQDITERKRTEAALRESEEKYRLIAENTADLISVLDMNLRFTYVSPAGMRLRGYTVEEAMEQTLEQVLTPESMKLGLSVFEEEMQLEASGTADPDRTRILELEQYKKDGSTIWLEVNLSFLRDKDRKPIAILIVSRDISERKRAEDTLRESEKRFRLVFENANIGMCLVDTKGGIFKVNRQMCEIFGYSKTELEGMSVNTITHPDYQDVSLKFVRQAMMGETDHSEFEKKYINKQGRLVLGKVSSSLVSI